MFKVSSNHQRVKNFLASFDFFFAVKKFAARRLKNRKSKSCKLIKVHRRKSRKNFYRDGKSAQNREKS